MRILSGIQPSGRLHWGNYFAMMRPMVELQAQGEAFVFIAGYHALTSVTEPAKLREAMRDAALDFLACGLDPARAVFFRQSDVPEVTELAWLLSIVTPVGLLERCHSYKEKIARGIPATHGLFAYPVLMAADILAFQSELVPVGQDQKQHIEVARDIAIKFNNQFGRVFTLPEPLIKRELAVVPGIDGRKMSKSYGNHIELFGPEQEMRKRIMRIVTDSKPVSEPKDPDKCNVFALYKLFATESEARAMAERYRAGGYGYAQAKEALFEKARAYFAKMRAKRAELAAMPERVERILAEGAARARCEAQKTMRRARQAVGLD